MNFIETLRNARESRVAVLHEFLAQYDPQAKRLHAFFEGHDDIVFFMPHIERFLPDGFRILRYRCEGKGRVMEVFAEITRRLPNVRHTLFFVDKDLDDVLGTPWPTDPRIFVTDVYSIENYIVTANVLERAYRDLIRLTGVTFDESVIIKHFEAQLSKFHRKILGVMAWILVARRSGNSPILNNIQMSDMWRLTRTGVPVPVRGSRLNVLARQTGVSLPPGGMRRVREAARELSRVPCKRIVRGKFEAWFFLQFWRGLVAQVQALVNEKNGRFSIRIQLTESTLVAILARYVDTPITLERFLRAHLIGIPLTREDGSQFKPRKSWWRHLWNRFKKI